MPETQQRKLAAIMFTDIVGYTAMMQEDQSGAMRTVKRHQEVLENLTVRYRGEVLNYYGDGSLSIFNSASEAVRCARDIQAELQTEPQVPLRIGIHVGEVLIDEGKVFGDGVNLASRIESLGQPGMVLFSRKVYEEIRNQPDFMVSALGTFAFKNVSAGMEVFALNDGKTPLTAMDFSEAKLSTEEPPGFWEKVERRNLPRVVLVYLVLALLAAQLINVPSLQANLPGWLPSALQILLISGLPIAMLLAWFFERSPQGFVRTDSAAAAVNPFSSHQKKPLTDNLGIGLILLLNIVLYFALPGAANSSGTTHDQLSIGIIPFRNISGDDNNDHYGFGMASEVRNRLSLSKKFDNISSLQATAQFANTNRTPVEIGEALEVRYLLMGMFQIAGDNIRVNVELIDAETGQNVQELPTYEDRFSDIFKVQSQIAANVLRELDIFDEAGAGNDPSSTYTPDVLAYGYYLQGNELLLQDNTEENFLAAQAQFERAIALDSNYLSPWVGLMGVLTNRLWSREWNDTSLRRQTREVIDFINVHFPPSWEKTLAQGIYAYHGQGDYERGKQLFKQVLDENPENSHALRYLSGISKRRLQTREALQYLAKAQKQQPNNPRLWAEISIIMDNQGAYQEEMEAGEMAARFGNKRLGSLGYFFGAAKQGDMNLVPKDLRGERGYQWSFLHHYLKRDYSTCHTILDTAFTGGSITRDLLLYRKALLYHLQQRPDSSRQYATEWLAFFEAEKPNNGGRNFRKAEMLSVLGKGEQALELLRSGTYNNNNWVPLNDEDLLLSVLSMQQMLRSYTLEKDYPRATATLLAINEQFPAFGDYGWIRHNPLYDQIKAEYPPFQEALDNLQLPAIVPLREPLQN